ncbi:MAG: hypothetical protein KC731_32785, partial [Myxococcales bacterium]|nr:hypothetical protein [Myxococcales bacterium]
MRRSTALPIAAVLALYAAVSPVPWTAAGLLALLVVPLLVPLRAEASRLVETLLSAFVVVVGTVVLTSVYPNARATIAVLRSSWAAFAGAVLLLAVVRFYLKRPIGGDVATLALNLVALTACGGAVTGWLYPLAVVVVIGLTVV